MPVVVSSEIWNSIELLYVPSCLAELGDERPGRGFLKGRFSLVCFVLTTGVGTSWVGCSLANQCLKVGRKQWVLEFYHFLKFMCRMHNFCCFYLIAKPKLDKTWWREAGKRGWLCLTVYNGWIPEVHFCNCNALLHIITIREVMI